MAVAAVWLHHHFGSGRQYLRFQGTLPFNSITGTFPLVILFFEVNQLQHLLKECFSNLRVYL